MDLVVGEAGVDRSVVEALPDPVVVVDARGRIELVNAPMLALTGYTRKELRGRPIELLVPEASHAAHVAAREAYVESSDGRGMSAGRVVKARRKDGRTILVEVRLGAIHSRQGTHVLAVVRDISERERFEQNLLASEERFRLTFEESPLAMGMVDLEGRFLRVNQAFCELSGYSAEELEGRPMLAITHPDDRAMNWALVQEVMCGERPSYRLEKRYVRKDGVIVHVAMTASLVRDSAGRPLHFIGQLQDIGAQKELERLRTEWASIVAHDLRQPVHVISMNARLAQNLSRRGGDVQECIDAITASTRRLDRMIGDLLDLSRVEVRDLPLNRVPADLPALARAAVARIAPDAGDRPIELDVRGDIPAVSIDPDRMAQALDNLLTNAIKYGAEGTPIKVDIELRDDEVAVAVRSEGPGLGPEAMATLFQRFRRAATNGKVKGVGLGLYITRGLIEAHGGRIGVESSPTGPTVFRFTLPVG